MDQFDTLNLVVYNITNDAVNGIFKKHRRSFELMDHKYAKILKELKKYQDGHGGGLYTHTDILSREMHNPFILEKAANDFSYWLIEIHNVILDLLTNISAFAGGESTLKEFRDNLNTYVENLPATYTIRRKFIDQTPRNVNYEEVFIYNKKDWLDAIDLSYNVCEISKKNLEKIITMTDLLVSHVEKLKVHKTKIDSNNIGKAYFKEETGIENFLKYELKIHSVLNDCINKMVNYAVTRFADLVLVTGYIQDDINSIRGELWK